MLATAQSSSFAKLDFGGVIFIETPRNWKYLDENLRKHLNTAGEAATRLAGITPNPGENVILVTAHAYTALRTPSATLRLSVRYGAAPTQADVRELTKVSREELTQQLTPILAETRKALIGIGGIKKAKAVDARIVTNQSLLCIFTEFETEKPDGVTLSQTYICPLGTKSVKLSTSYRKSEAALFRPVLQYVWSSLRIN